MCLLAATVIGVSSVSAAEKIKKQKLQVFILLGQSNMVGMAKISTFQYLLQAPYKPAFDEVKGSIGSNEKAILQVRAAALCDDDRLVRHLRSRPGTPLAPNARQVATAG